MWFAVGWLLFAQTVLGESGAPVVEFLEGENASASGGSRFRVTFSPLTLEPVMGVDGQPYIRLSSPGCGARGVSKAFDKGNADGAGLPELPFYQFFIEVSHRQPVELIVRDVQGSVRPLAAPIHPRQAPLSNNESIPSGGFAFDPSAYQANALPPGGPARMIEDGILRGRRVISVMVFPVQYHPSARELRVIESVEIELVPSDTRVLESSLTDATRGGAARSLDAYNQLTAGFVFKAEETRPLSEASDDTRTPQIRYPSPTAVTDGYLIITTDACYEAVLPLARWKGRKGYAVTIRKVSEIGADATAIGAAITSAYHHGNPPPGYVLLVGDFEDLPAPYYAGELNGYSDQLYSYVDGDDSFPDLFIGRIPTAAPTDCERVIQRILTYEQTPDPRDWYRRFLTAGLFQDTGEGGAQNDGVANRWFMEALVRLTDYLTTHEGMDALTAWTTDSPTHHTRYEFNPLGYPHRPTPQQPVPQWVVDQWQGGLEGSNAIRAAINSGVSFVFHRDHGFETGWGDPPFSNNHVATLNNGVLTPVVFSINCNTGRFYRTEGDCFAEAFLKHANGGAVGIVAGVRPSFSGYNDLLSEGLWTCLWPNYDPDYSASPWPVSRRPAEALAFAKFYMYRYMGEGSYTEGTFNMFHWFGDPEMALRLESPQVLTVTHPTTAPVQIAASLTFQVSLGGEPLSGARVAVTVPRLDETLSSPALAPPIYCGLTDKSGQLVLEGVRCEDLALRELVVTHPRAVPYVSEIQPVVATWGHVALDREFYRGQDRMVITLGDADLKSQIQTDVLVVASSGDREWALLDRLDSEWGLFKGEFEITTVRSQTGQPKRDNGILEVLDGDVLEVIYDNQAPDKPEGYRTDSAVIDTRLPAILSMDSDIRHLSARFCFETDEVTTMAIEVTTQGITTVQTTPWGLTHCVVFDDLTPESQYAIRARARDRAGNETAYATGSEDGLFQTGATPNYYTQQAGTLIMGAELKNLSLKFTPDASSSFYHLLKQRAASFFVDPAGGKVLTSPEGRSIHVTLPDQPVALYGIAYRDLYIHTDGSITFGIDAGPQEESFDTHFFLPRVSAALTNLTRLPNSQIIWNALSDRVAVTWAHWGDPDGTGDNDFQMELFFTGAIRITYGAMTAPSFIAGLSEGRGTPNDFTESAMQGEPSSGMLILTPDEHYESVYSGTGAVSPSSERRYALINDSDVPLPWSSLSTVEWARFRPAEGVLAPGALQNLSVEIEYDLLPIGSYEGQLIIKSPETTQTLIREAHVDITSFLGQLVIEDSTRDPADRRVAFPALRAGQMNTQMVTIRNGHTTYPLTVSQALMQPWLLDTFDSSEGLDWVGAMGTDWTRTEGQLRFDSPNANTTSFLFHPAPIESENYRLEARIRRPEPVSLNAVVYMALRCSDDFTMTGPHAATGSACVLALDGAGRGQFLVMDHGSIEIPGEWMDLTHSDLTGPTQYVAIEWNQGAVTVTIDHLPVWQGSGFDFLAPGRFGLGVNNGDSGAVVYVDDLIAGPTREASRSAPIRLGETIGWPQRLDPGETLTLPILFNPPTAPGAYRESLLVITPGSNEPLAEVSVTGAAVAGFQYWLVR